MDFITGLLRSAKKHDSIMVFMNNLTKESHFIHVKSTYKVNDIDNIFIRGIFKLHGFPKAIISKYDAKFTSSL